MDVRMLGGGRPFVLEVVNAKAEAPSAEAFRGMEAALNASGVGVEVRRLQPIARGTVQLIRVTHPLRPPCA
jgi:tRNA pseudouridine synthase 10